MPDLGMPIFRKIRRPIRFDKIQYKPIDDLKILLVPLLICKKTSGFDPATHKRYVFDFANDFHTCRHLVASGNKQSIWMGADSKAEFRRSSALAPHSSKVAL